MKGLFFGMLVSVPGVAVWIFRNSESAHSDPEVKSISNTTRAESIVRVPVEVIATGSSPEWIYIEVPRQALPKPPVSPGSR